MMRSISSIELGIRHRRDLGDVEALARSINEVGLLHPIVVTPDGTLIAGERRLVACIKLGWTSVPVNVVDIAEIVRGEFAENAARKDFLPSEVDAIRRAMGPVVKTPEGRPKKTSASCASFEPGKTSEKIANFAGISGRTVDKIPILPDKTDQPDVLPLGADRGRASLCTDMATAD